MKYINENPEQAPEALQWLKASEGHGAGWPAD